MFLYPTMLLAALAVAAPIIIHLIQRQQFPRRWVATVRFLPKDRRVNRFALRLVDVLQLLLRVAVLCLLALLMARPFVGMGESAPRNFVFVLDTSMSMGAAGSVSGTTALTEAKAWAKDTISSLGRRDGVGLAIADATVGRVIPPTREHKRIQDVVDRIEAGERGSGAVLPGVLRACELLAGRRERANVVFVLSDVASNLIDRDHGEVAKQIRASLGAGRLDLRFVRFGKAAPQNATITDARLTPQTAAVGSSVKVTPRVRNQSDKDLRVAVGLRDRGLPVGSARPVTVPPRSECVMDLVTLFKSRGSSYATMALGDDDLRSDNEFSLPMRPSARSQVLIVTGTKKAEEEPGTEQVDVPTLLSYALNPAFSLTGETGTNRRPQIVRSDSIGAVALDRYQLYILCGVSSLTDRTLEDLRALLAGSRERRGLIIVPEESMNALRFNEVFTAVGEPGNLPLTAAALGAIVPCDPPVRWAATASSSPIMAPFRGPTGLAEDIRMFRRFHLNPMEGADVFLHGTDGAPLGVVMDYGRGRIATLAFPLAREFTSLVQTPAMLTFVWQVADYLTGRTALPPLEETKTGRQMALDLSDLRGIHGNARLRHVTDKGMKAELFPLAENTEQIVSRFDRSGVYELGHEKRYQDRSRFVAVNVPPSEGDLSPLSKERLAEALGAERCSLRMPDVAAKDIPSGTELWPWALALLAVLYGVEAIAALILSLRKQEAARA